MGNTRDQVGKVGLFLASGVFRTAFYVCVALLIFWLGKSAYQFGYDVFNQQAVSPGAGQEVTVVIPDGASTYDVAKILKSKGLIQDSLVFFALHTHLPVLWESLQEMRSRQAFLQMTVQMLLQIPAAMLHLMVQRIPQQGKESPASDRRRKDAHLHQFS